ncbi:hypothetical protein [Cellulomonas soli]|uniref:hypothetical protein n=1 Tax=Cellulomonas soli TaxID=931535 RepID=UPI0011BDB9A5|nr:hypothetical protein [Cellulomonas soli]NYI61090.1 hypothetical protein [Cellulomonas soli]
MAVVVGIVLALIVAAVVLVAAARSAAHEGENPVADLVSAWRERGGPSGAARAEVAEAAPVDVSLTEFLQANVEQGDAYLQVDELADRLQRATDATRRAMPGSPGHADRRSA